MEGKKDEVMKYIDEKEKMLQTERCDIGDNLWLFILYSSIRYINTERRQRETALEPLP